MVSDIYAPLDEYTNTFEPRFREVSKQTFADIAREAAIDVVSNRDTCTKIYETEDNLRALKSRLSKRRWLCGILWCLAVAIVAYFFVFSTDLTPLIIAEAGIAVLAIVLLQFAKVLPAIRQLKAECNDTSAIVETLKEQAWQQMQPLNDLYDWDVLARMMSRTIPRLEFDPYFTTQRLADLKTVYGWDESFSHERSVIYSHSGLINGNPFVLCRTRIMSWGTKTYHGSLTISWTSVERDANGKTYTQTRTQVLHAQYTAPYPLYEEQTHLIYGNTSAPDLAFSRKRNGLADKTDSLRFKWKHRQLRKKAEDLEGSDFAMLTNEEFEVAFDTRDRNNNQQYALLFTPLAQQNMMALLTDRAAGYGDDFDFYKDGMVNVVMAEHMQGLFLDMNPKQFFHFDYEKAVENFRATSSRYFRAIYFNLAPLLCIPMYQHIRPHHDIYGSDAAVRSTYWEHEALANFWGEERFRHRDCTTNCILKTRQQPNDDGSSDICVEAHGFKAEQRMAYISVWGGDGRTHSVPVVWYEYLPVVGKGKFRMQEDNTDTPSTASQAEITSHISEVLASSNMTCYRRHIASRML